MTALTLTPRQLQVLNLMARGLTRAEIAAELWLGAGTIASHQRAIYTHLDVHNAHGAVAAGYRTGLLAVEPATTPS